jgi:serine/threonine protein kinase
MTALERSALGSLTPLGSGGQGDVYRAPRAHINFASSAAFKEYKAIFRSQVDFGALEAMSSFLAGQTFAEGSRIVERVAWPISLVADQGRPVGFLMPEVPDSFAVTLQLPSGAKKRDLAQFQHLLNPGAYLARRGIAISERDRYLLLAHLAESLALLHGHDVVVGDLSPKNVLFSLDPTPRCFFVDADAMRLAGRSALPQAETPDWEIRTVSSEELATKASDSYKLGLFVLRLLAGDQATRDPGVLPQQVPADVRNLLVRSLSVTPTDRPTPSAWVALLRTAAAGASTALPVLGQPRSPQVTTPQPRPAPRPVPPAVVVRAAQPAYIRSPGPSTSTAPDKGLPWGKLAGAGVAVVIVALVASNLTHSSNPGNNGYNPQDATPTATPTTTTTATLTPMPTPVTGAAVLYQADWSTGLGGWTGRSDWKTTDGMLVDDGTGPHNWQLSVTAPYTPSTPNYAIEADIQVVNVGGCSSFGLVARATDSAPGNQGGINYCEFRGANLWDVADANTGYDPGSGWHTYRLEVQANELRFFVDGVLMVSGMDNQYLAPGKVGLWCDQMQVNVRSFRVLNLGTTTTATP